MTPTRVLINHILIVLAIAIFGVLFATLWAAMELEYQRWLGVYRFALLLFPVYYPWRLFGWWYAYEDYAPSVFEHAGIIVSSGGFISIAVAISGSVLRARQNRLVTTYGSSRWAFLREAEEAALLESAGVLLGRFKDQCVRHDGPENVAAFALARSGEGVGLVVPVLLSRAGGVVVHDIKGKNRKLTAAWRSNLTPGEVMQLPARSELVLVSGLPPIRARKQRYHQDRNFTSRILPAPQLSAEAYADRPAPRPDNWSGQVRSTDARLEEKADATASGTVDPGGLQQQRRPGLPERSVSRRDRTKQDGRTLFDDLDDGPSSDKSAMARFPGKTIKRAFGVNAGELKHRDGDDLLPSF